MSSNYSIRCGKTSSEQTAGKTWNIVKIPQTFKTTPYHLVEPGVMPPFGTKYLSTCNLTAQFHIMASNTQVNNMTDRFLILSVSLPESAYPSNLAHSRIQDIFWPDTYQYEYDVSSRTHKIPPGTIWQAHKLKLESISIPTPMESLRFRSSFD